MTLMEQFLKDCAAICEGELSPPDGISLSTGTPMERAVELHSQIRDIPGFVRACAQVRGETLPESLFDDFREEDVEKALSQISLDVEDEPPREDRPNVFEAFASALLLEEGLTAYLIHILRSDDRLSFFKLSKVAVQADIDPHAFLYWLGHKEDFADETERSCARLYDGVMDRLLREGGQEVAAALLSGDRNTFEAFRREAPELQGMESDAYQQFCEYYLDRHYPLRLMLRFNGISFPDDPVEKDG